MLGNDQIETLAERLLRGITKQCSGGAVPPDDFATAVCIDDSICDLIEDFVSQLGPVFHGDFFRFRSCQFGRYSSAGEAPPRSVPSRTARTPWLPPWMPSSISTVIW